MAFSLGTRVGPYEIVAPLGAGGMGEVYRARDTRLQRDVAIKILPELFALDPDRRARFEREAQVLASLNHPHIAAIYGFEDTNSTGAIVMELVEGPTLADRLARGPVPVPETLAIAQQLVIALDAAHEKGIVHRDLKPSNIKLTADGTVKVLDFGLAKALAGDAVRADITQSPTLSAIGTRAGVILGTAAYMSPEQARGQSVDKRADIWAFGCVVYELLTGRKVFDGATVSDTVAAILTRDPDWSRCLATPRLLSDGSSCGAWRRTRRSGCAISAMQRQFSTHPPWRQRSSLSGPQLSLRLLPPRRQASRCGGGAFSRRHRREPLSRIEPSQRV